VKDCAAFVFTRRSAGASTRTYALERSCVPGWDKFKRDLDEARKKNTVEPRLDSYWVTTSR
jgi:hypothetical protein